MTRRWRDERARLFIRTAELKQRSRVLAEPGRPFSQADHDELRDQLHQHFVALTEFKHRCMEEGRWTPPALTGAPPRATRSSPDPSRRRTSA